MIFYRKMISLGFPSLTFQVPRSSDFSLVSLHFFPHMVLVPLAKKCVSLHMSLILSFQCHL